MRDETSPWRTARRLSLAVRSSFSSLSRPLEESNDNVLLDSAAQNIDQAMRSLYSTELKPTLWTRLQNNNNSQTNATTSYIPTHEFDWMLDESPAASHVSESNEWLIELKNGGDRRIRELERYVAKWEEGLQSSFEFEESSSDDEESERSDSEFGEFQSAADDTAELVDRAESLLQQHPVLPEFPHCHSPLTPDLLERSEQVVAAHWRKSNSLLNERTRETVSHPKMYVESFEECDEDKSTDQPDLLPLFIDLPSPVPASLPLAARGVEDRPISLKLPWQDYSTFEGRFLRRRQQKFFEENNEVLGLKQHEDDDESVIWTAEDQDRCIQRLQEKFNLPEYYFSNPDFDDGVKLLGSLPWHNLMALYSKSEGITENSDIEVWDAYMTTLLSNLDAALKEMQKVSLRHVQPLQSELLHANRLIYDLDRNIRLTEMYMDRCCDALKTATGEEVEATGLAGSIIVLKAFDGRENYRKLDNLLQDIARADQSVNDLYNTVDTLSFQHENGLSDYERITGEIDTLRKTLTNECLANVRALDLTRSRLDKIGERIWSRLSTLCQSTIVCLCRRSEFDSVSHKRLFDVCLDVNKRFAADLPDGITLVTWWSEQINKSFCYETERSLAVALADPAYEIVRSDYSKDLDQLADEIDLDWGDQHKLRYVIRNLTTIRFDFEGSFVNYLPGVMRKLCVLLRSILVSSLKLTGWHASLGSRNGNLFCDVNTDLTMVSFSNQVQRIKEHVWNNCEAAIVQCLDGYLASRGGQSLFHYSKHDVDETLWLQDVKKLCIIYALVDRFISQKRTFLESAEASDDIVSLAGKGNMIVDRLSDVFRRHLKSLHVEVMNASGRKLANECWILQALDASSAKKASDASNLHSGPFVAEALLSRFRPYENRFSFLPLLHDLDFSVVEEEGLNINGNRPFDRLDDIFVENDTIVPGIEIHSECLFRMRFQDEIDDRGATSRIAPDYVTNDFLEWLARLLTVIKCFPLVAEDVSVVVANLCDLYTTTILRLCAGSAQNEKHLLGIITSNPFQVENNDNHQKNNYSGASIGNNLLDAFRKSRRPSRNSAYMRMVSDTLDAEICEPLLSDTAEINSLRDFVTRAQASLKDAVNLDKVDAWMRHSGEERPLDEEVCEACRFLEKRVAGALSLYAVASITDAFYDIAKAFLSGCPVGSQYLSFMESLQKYSKTLSSVTPSLVRVSTQIACQRAMNGSDIVTNMICNEAAWEESKLNEDPNDYVESMCERCALFWGFLTTSGKLPDKALAFVWSGLMTAAYSTMLEGFSRISFCSTEGRALMTLDLASFSSGVTPQAVKERLDKRSLFVKPVQEPQVLIKGMSYVDTYIKVFYCPDKDVMEWIRNNYCKYRPTHILALRIPANHGNSSQAWKELSDLYCIY
ncbi:hypothetical protein FisN_20Lh137 [Fistulifera solaris]|uniref:Syndetin C-terminal domain-containing protein n=1 Tax=Fistulifera solaris TaxID=1519565 RepID=A0A1Z5KRX3_FISSO|nr:hypothetical protein FisN_20Lh137 [Fistulifera solaris]|eukprot:GAX28842.1 hypothetical protein FisN_20Lh137 [Fistulifera solaris]